MIRVAVKHEKDIEISDIFNGSVVPLFGGTGLLQDELSSTDSAYIVQKSQIVERAIQKKCVIQINNERILIGYTRSC